MVFRAGENRHFLISEKKISLFFDSFSIFQGRVTPILTRSE